MTPSTSTRSPPGHRNWALRRRGRDRKVAKCLLIFVCVWGAGAIEQWKHKNILRHFIYTGRHSNCKVFKLLLIKILNVKQNIVSGDCPVTVRFGYTSSPPRCPGMRTRSHNRLLGRQSSRLYAFNVTPSWYVRSTLKLFYSVASRQLKLSWDREAASHRTANIVSWCTLPHIIS